MLSEKLFILVGGKGTRLRSVITEIPKPMAPVSNKPFLWYKLQQSKSVGFRKFIFCSGYLSKHIEEYFGDGSSLGVQIEYSEEDEPLGTAGAISNAKHYIDKPFFVCNGDTYLNFNPAPMLNFIKKNEIKHCILLTKPQIIEQEGCVDIENNGRITRFIEKPKKEVGLNLINAGIYYLSPSILEFIPESQKISLEHDTFPSLIQSEEGLYGFEYNGYFIDIGIPKNYARFCKDVGDGEIRFN